MSFAMESILEGRPSRPIALHKGRFLDISPAQIKNFRGSPSRPPKSEEKRSITQALGGTTGDTREKLLQFLIAHGFVGAIRSASCDANGGRWSLQKWHQLTIWASNGIRRGVLVERREHREAQIARRVHHRPSSILRALGR